MSHKEQQEHINKLRAEEAQIMAGNEVKDRWGFISMCFHFIKHFSFSLPSVLL